ncbi:hypothetical protein FB451DRAFT_1255486 [Mycena latifolia]|nr:hypothetical protein FB451DRAFT_1255486 [Mycena latifolia]
MLTAEPRTDLHAFAYASPGPAAAGVTAAAAQVAGQTGGATPFPPTNAANQRICRQCGLPGRYKEGKCVEKWGPGPLGPGTVCDRCRKKMKRVERRGTLEQQSLQQAAAAVTPAASTSFRTSSVHRNDTLPTAYREPAQESSMRSSLAASPSHPSSAAPAAPAAPPPTPTPNAGRIIKNRLTPVPGPGAAGGAPGLLPPLRTHSPMEVDDEDLDADAEAEVDEIDGDGDAGDAEGDADGEGEGEADPEADLLEAVDAAEAASNSNSSGGRGGRMKSED